ncbi:HTH-type transcriptional regulator IscR [bacterium BMS3Abin05]|nr:HTH-type transcriptional regulator IscR [bacterium BMS3Abin05]GBE27975.1 HTH-type transcriptional regulator IscR [bacterium BMS3Bbin03]HDK36409.1 Rrf2 family transcriptional regulator [Bacteroidota bacterium]HDL78223.1 Rrf2 family transcriptional regulator [Bacteroidota bacterium]HDZ10772.1 Rrf2 family transcriptional regulator [Bacteroidota bacterium]
MLRLSKKTEYALIALKDIALNSRIQLMTAREISENHQVPRDLLAKILQTLTHHSIIRSVQGAKGGYILNKPVEEITLLGLIEILDGPAGLMECSLPEPVNCTYLDTCSIRCQLALLNQKILAMLQGITLRHFLRNELKAVLG